MIKVSENAGNITGTSAELGVGDVLSVNDLLYGLMLPSGNDAAVALAEHFGEMLLQVKKDVA
jgi:D-alanyl-D-alanine carboxypeptidase (penicillin-binding protein 5/6)